MDDEDIVAKWTQEGLATEFNGRMLAPEHVEYVLCELKWYRDAWDKDTGLQVRQI